MADLPHIIDAHGTIRRMGLLPDPFGFVSAMPRFEDNFPVFNDDQIKNLLADPNRLNPKSVFDSSWILDQGNAGSCAGHAAAAAASRSRYRRGSSDKLLFGGAYPYSKVNRGRDQGAVLEDVLVAIQKYGFAPLSVVGPKMIFPSQQPANADAEASKHKALVAYACGTRQGLKSGLAAGFDAVVAVMAGNNFMRVNARGIAGVDNGGGNHCVACQGLEWDPILQKWVYGGVNSWSPTYGVNGCMGLLDAHFDQTDKTNTFYALAALDELNE